MTTDEQKTTEVQATSTSSCRPKAQKYRWAAVAALVVALGGISAILVYYNDGSIAGDGAGESSEQTAAPAAGPGSGATHLGD